MAATAQPASKTAKTSQPLQLGMFAMLPFRPDGIDADPEPDGEYWLTIDQATSLFGMSRESWSLALEAGSLPEPDVTTADGMLLYFTQSVIDHAPAGLLPFNAPDCKLVDRQGLAVLLGISIATLKRELKSDEITQHSGVISSPDFTGRRDQSIWLRNGSIEMYRPRKIRKPRAGALDCPGGVPLTLSGDRARSTSGGNLLDLACTDPQDWIDKAIDFVANEFEPFADRLAVAADFCLQPPAGENCGTCEGTGCDAVGVEDACMSCEGSGKAPAAPVRVQ